MSRNVIETVMGAVVLVIAGSFLVTAYEGRKINKVDGGYHLKARFENATGVATGSDVRLGGVKVGVVDGMDLDTKSYQAVVGMTIRSGVPLPLDTTAAIVGDGLLGSKFVALTPGADDAMLKDGAEIEYTQSSVSLEEMIGKFVFSGGGVEADEDSKASTDDDEPELNF